MSIAHNPNVARGSARASDARDLRSNVWAVTCYFDPLGTRNRLPAYRVFRRHLQIPLVTVELSCNERFDLGSNDAEILIQLRGQAMLWQKERLLNIALQALPDHCDTVAWLDCDIVFTRADWYVAAQEQLERSGLVQPFSRVHLLDSVDWVPGVEERNGHRVSDSVALRFAAGTLPEESFRVVGSSRRFRYAPGFAWTAPRKLLKKWGLYDTEILGYYSDKLMFAAACGCFHEASQAVRYNSHPRGQLFRVGGELP